MQIKNKNHLSLFSAKATALNSELRFKIKTCYLQFLLLFRWMELMKKEAQMILSFGWID